MLREARRDKSLLNQSDCPNKDRQISENFSQQQSYGYFRYSRLNGGSGGTKSLVRAPRHCTVETSRQHMKTSFLVMKEK